MLSLACMCVSFLDPPLCSPPSPRPSPPHFSSPRDADWLCRRARRARCARRASRDAIVIKLKPDAPPVATMPTSDIVIKTMPAAVKRASELDGAARIERTDATLQRVLLRAQAKDALVAVMKVKLKPSETERTRTLLRVRARQSTTAVDARAAPRHTARRRAQADAGRTAANRQQRFCAGSMAALVFGPRGTSTARHPPRKT
jgi:hypothetical protein